MPTVGLEAGSPVGFVPEEYGNRACWPGEFCRSDDLALRTGQFKACFWQDLAPLRNFATKITHLRVYQFQESGEAIRSMPHLSAYFARLNERPSVKNTVPPPPGR